MIAWMAAALIMGSGTTLAQTNVPSSATGATASQAKTKPPKAICRSEDTTGSLFPTRTCHSKEEWSAIDAANAANAERIRNSRNGVGRN